MQIIQQKRFRSHRIASKKMDLLYEAGMAYKDAQKLVIMEGEQKLIKQIPHYWGTIMDRHYRGIVQ